jgi:hypothetical protein
MGLSNPHPNRRVMATKTKWTKPLKVVTHLDLKSLRGLLAKHAPIGKKRPSGFMVGKKRYTYRVPPRSPGRLRKAFYKKGAVKLSRSGKSILIEAPGADYARAVDKGRRGFTVTPKRKGKNLMFSFAGRFFFKRARIPPAKGQHFTKAAFKEWASRRKIHKSIKIRWAARGEKGGVTTTGSRLMRGG